MAIDNLNYYSSWLPAWQQTDKYSSQPWCLKSKNLDIFSSSKSVKATAFTAPTTWDADVIKEEWWLVLKTDWKVYERVDGVDTLFVDPSINFPSYDVKYEWSTYTPATWWTVQDMVVKTEWNTWKSFVVYTDRASYTYSKVKYTLDKEFENISSNLTYDTYSPYAHWYRFTKNSTSWSGSEMEIRVSWNLFSKIPIRVYAEQYNDSPTDISLASVTVYTQLYTYDAQLDAVIPRLKTMDVITPTWDITQGISLSIDSFPWAFDRWIMLKFKYTRHEWESSYWWNGALYVDMNTPDVYMSWSDGDFNDYYSYLPVRDRKLTPVWEYYWMKWSSFQPLYSWNYEWVEDANDNKVTRYNLIQEYWWENNVSMDIIWITFWNDQVYMIGNMNWNWYIIPCDLTWGRWTPYIAYWCTFKGVTNIDYLMYLVWENRWISCLWVYNWQELVPVIWGREEKDSKNLIKNEEQYKFDWKIVNWRKNLILTTEDNRIFQYWQTYGGKGWVFIHELPENATITWLKTNWNDLEIGYSITESWTTTNYAIKYQDDTPIKNYNLEWMAEYPIVLWNHLLEKEESDLFVSYILPSADCSLEFWGMANHYHFRTFTSSDSYTFSTTANYKLKGCTWNYVLKYIETNGNQYTFRLEWDMLVQTTNDMKITDTEWVELINYSEYNHFRKIGEITTTEYQEWEFRFHNLNNKLELPKSHSLQIMVKGKGTQNYTPELFALDLVANQRERW